MYADLDQRAMLSVRSLAELGDWGDTMGPDEARLHARLEREWLLWRDDLIRSGIKDVTAVRTELVLRQREGERRKRPELGGKSASEVIHIERSKAAGQEKLTIPGTKR